MSRVPVPLQLVVLAVGLTAVYTMVGQAVPQKEVQPPEVIEIQKDLSPEEMVEVGKGIFNGKGICTTCHTIGKSGALRFPDLQGVGERAAKRKPGMSAAAYLAESLYEPNAFIVPGFNPGMPEINKPPIGLTDQEILAVIAFLETLGGEVTVTMDTKFVYTGGGEDAGAATTADATPADGSAVLASRGCTQCHRLDAPGAIDGSPSLWDVGRRLGRPALVDKVAYHPPTPSAPYPKDLTLAEIQAMVDYLTGLGGSV